MPEAEAPAAFQGRFGNTDAARVNLTDFIPISGVFPDPHQNPDAMEDRIVVGRKGAGKTLYLRKLEEEANKRNLLTLGRENILPTDLVRYLLMRLREYVQSVDRSGALESHVDWRKAVASMWRAIWEKAILVSALSLYLSHKRRSGDLKINATDFRHKFPTLDSMESYLVENYADLFNVPLSPITPQKCVELFAARFDTSRQLQKFMNDPKWVELQSIIDAVINEAPPMAIYVDAIDLEFEDAPEAFLLCQIGLYRAVAQSGLTSSSPSGRLHVVAALRDIVFSAILRSEHAGRYYQNRHVKFLEWTPSTIRKFLFEKMKQVVTVRSISSHRSIESLVQDWIGFTEFTNGRSERENVVDYLLRHSRMLPRDLIMLLNAIDTERQRRGSTSQSFGAGSLRKAVAEVAHVIGNEMLVICMNEMLSSSDLFADFASAERGRDRHDNDFAKFIRDRVDIFFRAAEKETLSYDELKAALVRSQLVDASSFEAGAHTYYRFDNLLWRHGLMAYREESGAAVKWRFNWKGAVATDVIPTKADFFGFHSSLIDVYGLKPTIDGPVC